MPPRINQGQLERAVGGADKLLQLADRRRTGNINDPVAQAFICEVMSDANNEVNGYISLAVDMADPRLQTAPMLLRYEKAIAARIAYRRGTGGLAMPPEIAAEADDAMDELQKIADRKKGLALRGGVGSSSQPIQQVPDDPTRPFFSRRGPRRRFDGWS